MGSRSSDSPLASIGNKVKALCGGEKKQGMTPGESLRLVSKLDSVFGKEDAASIEPDHVGPAAGAQYDPINMGALKQTEIDAHKRGLKEMSPFANTGPAAPNKILRDDDDYTRNTGVTWIGGRPRTVNKVVSGPQAGARQVTSTAEKDIRETHIRAMNAPQWG
jgi:hypothetical protein